MSPTLNLPLEVFCKGFYQLLYLTTSICGWVGCVPQQPVLCCHHIPVSPERPWCQNSWDWPQPLPEFVLTAVLSGSSYKLLPEGQVLLSPVGNRDRHFSSNSLWAGHCQDHQHFSADTKSRPSISHPLKALQHVCDDAEQHSIPRQVQRRALDCKNQPFLSS